MRCAIYARYSSDLQRSESIDDQVRQCRQFIQSKGWMLVEQHVFTDYAITGTDANRPGYNELKVSARQGQFDCVVVDDLSRLGRDTAESIGVFHELSAFDINIVSVADGIDTSSSSAKLPYYFKSIMNEIYLDDLKEKVLRGMKGQVLRGYSAGGRAYGYSYTDVYDRSGAKDKYGRQKRLGVTISVDPKQANIVKHVYDLKLKGLGVKRIAQSLNEKGVAPPQHSRSCRIPSWSTSTVWSILNNRKYIGDWSWGKKKWPKIPGTSRRRCVDLPKSQWVTSIREDLKIIDQATWDAVQQLRKKSKPINPLKNGKLTGYQGIGHRAKYLLSGLLECGQCGGSMIAISSDTRSVYVCNNHWSRGKTVCTNKVRVKRADVETAVIDSLSERLLNPDMLQLICDKANQKLMELLSDRAKDEGPLRRRLKNEQKQLNNMVNFVMAGDTSLTVRERINEKEASIEALKGQLSDFRRMKATSNTVIGKKWVVGKLRHLKELLGSTKESLKLAQLELKSLLDGKIVLSPEDIGDHYRIRGLIRAKLSYLFAQPLSVIVYGGGGNRTPVRI